MLVVMKKQWIAAVALLGCAHAAPPWPKPSVSETDGGESLAPREAKSVVVAAKETKPEVKPAENRPSTDTKPATPAPPVESVVPPAPAASVEDPEEETIVIEVED